MWLPPPRAAATVLYFLTFIFVDAFISLIWWCSWDHNAIGLGLLSNTTGLWDCCARQLAFRYKGYNGRVIKVYIRCVIPCIRVVALQVS